MFFALVYTRKDPLPALPADKADTGPEGTKNRKTKAGAWVNNTRPGNRGVILGKLYYESLLMVYFSALAVCGVCRTLLVLSFMDRETGFYLVNNGIVTVFNVALVAAVLFWFVASRLRRPHNDYPVAYRSVVAGGLSILTGLSILAHVFLDSPYPDMEQGYSALLLQGRTVASMVLGSIAALSFFLFARVSFMGRASRAAVWPGLFAGLWQAFMLVTRFNSYTTLTTITDNLLAVLFMVFASLFLVGHARTLLGYARKDGRNYTIPAGLAASLIGFVLTVPNYITMLAQNIPMPAQMLGTWEAVYTLLLSIYALVFVVGTIRTIKQV